MQKNQWVRGKDHFKEKIFIIFVYFAHIYHNNRKHDSSPNNFQIEDIVKQPIGKQKNPFQIEDISCMDPRFST